jgi:tRNA 2-thiouridine synthesizing protein E
MAAKSIAGETVEVNEEGFLVNPDQWTPEIASEMAKEEGINQLTEKHWQVINFMRNDFKEHASIPTIRRMKNASGVSIQEIYALFPDGPAKKAAKIAGLGKPQGCI